MTDKKGGAETAGSGRSQKVRPVHALLLDNQLLADRLYFYSLARYLVVGAIIGGALFAAHAVGVEGLDISRLTGVAVILALYNSLIFSMLHRTRTKDSSILDYRALSHIMHGTILLDFVFLTIALWLVGGSRSPFAAFYLFHVILASVILPRRAVFVHTAIGFAFLAALAVAEWLGWIPRYTPAGAVPAGADGLDGRYVLTLLVVYGLLFALSASMLTSLMELLRAGARKIRRTNEQLRELLEMRRDFMHIAMHDLKSPVVSVSQQLYALETGLEDSLTPAQRDMFERCRIRLKQSLDFVRDLEFLAKLENDDLKHEAAPLDLRKLLQEVFEEQQDYAKTRKHTLTADIPDDLPAALAIERLLKEAVANLVTNAVKYTPEGGEIHLRARHSGGTKVRIEVEDNGIGISAEDQKRLFREFARIRPEGKGVDTANSSGLGLSIVRRVIEAFGGRAGVESESGMGSTFYIELPVGTGEATG
jgi:signal transduction histidine kinase